MLRRGSFNFYLLCLLCFFLLAQTTAVDVIPRHEKDNSNGLENNDRGHGSGPYEITMSSGSISISPSAGGDPPDPGAASTRTVQNDPSTPIAGSTSIILITSLTIETLSSNPPEAAPPSQTFSPLATITAASRTNSATSHRHRIPFFWRWLRR